MNKTTAILSAIPSNHPRDLEWIWKMVEQFYIVAAGVKPPLGHGELVVTVNKLSETAWVDTYGKKFMLSYAGVVELNDRLLALDTDDVDNMFLIMTVAKRLITETLVLPPEGYQFVIDQMAKAVNFQPDTEGSLFPKVGM